VDSIIVDSIGVLEYNRMIAGIRLALVFEIEG